MLVILAVWLLGVVIVPAIDSAVSSKDLTTAGDRLSVTETVAFTPAPGWNIDSGFRVDQHSASSALPAVALTRSSVALSLDADTFDGTADELLSQIDAVSAVTNGGSVLAIASAPEPVTTDGGVSGIQIRFDTPRAAGSVTTFVVGEKFRLFQPRNVVFWMYLWFCGFGVVQAWQMLAPMSGYFGRALLVAGIVGDISALVWGWWFRHVDRYERQPLGLVITGFVWGATASSFTIAIPGNDALGSLYTKLLGQVWSQDWHAGLSTPFVEETAKGIGRRPPRSS